MSKLVNFFMNIVQVFLKHCISQMPLTLEQMNTADGAQVENKANWLENCNRNTQKFHKRKSTFSLDFQNEKKQNYWYLIR